MTASILKRSRATRTSIARRSVAKVKQSATHPVTDFDQDPTIYPDHEDYIKSLRKPKRTVSIYVDILLFVAFCVIFLPQIKAHIPAHFRHGKADEQPPTSEYTTLFSILVMITFMVIDRLLTSKIAVTAMKKFKAWLESKLSDSKSHQAYRDARDIFTTHHAESADSASLEPLEPLQPPDEPTDIQPTPDGLPPAPEPKAQEAKYQSEIPLLAKVYTVCIATSMQMETFFKSSASHPRTTFLRILTLHFCLYFVPYPQHFTWLASLSLIFFVLFARTYSRVFTALKDRPEFSEYYDQPDEGVSARYSSTKQAANKILNPLEVAVDSGKKNAGAAADDLSVGTQSTGVSLESLPFEHLLDPIAVKADTSEIDGFLQAFSFTSNKAVLNFIVLFFTAPKWESSSALCITHHMANFHGLFTALCTLHGDKMRHIWSLLRDAIKSSGGVFAFESDSESEKFSWIHDVANGLDELKRFETSPIGTTLGSMLAIIATLPILVQDFLDAKTYMSGWKVCMKTFKTVGGSFSSVMQQLLYVYRSSVSASTTGNPTLVLQSLFQSDDFHRQYIQCYSQLKDIRDGKTAVRTADADVLRTRFLRLANRAQERLSPLSSPAEISRVKECISMRDDVCLRIASNTDKRFPYTVSYHGGAGTGKSTFQKAIQKPMHAWIGKEDIMSVSEPNIADKHDNITTNSTTMIVLDDCGNIVPEFRETPLGYVLLQIGQAKPMPICKAAVEDKGKHFYFADFCVLLDNHVERGLKMEMYEPYAGYRRLGLCVEMKTRKAFQNTSGGVDHVKAKNAGPYGAASLFRPFKITKPPGGSTVEVNYFNDNAGWVDNFTYLKFLKADVLAHFAAEDHRLACLRSANDQALCSRCNLLPNQYCECGDDFFDADEPNVSSDMHETLSTEVVRAFENGTFAVTGSIQAALATVATSARLKIVESSSSANMLFYLLDNRLQIYATSFLFYVSLGLLVFRFSIPGCILFLLSLILVYISRALDRHWTFLHSMDVRQLIEVRMHCLRRFYPKIAFGFGCLSAIALFPTVWRSMIDTLPFGPAIVAESKEEPKSEESPPAQPADEYENVYRIPDPSEKLSTVQLGFGKIWEKPRRLKLTGYHCGNTISTEDLMALVSKNSYEAQFHRGGKSHEFGTQRLLMINSSLAMTTAHSCIEGNKIVNITLVPTKGSNLPGPISVSKSQMFVAKGTDILLIHLFNPFGHLKDLSRYFPENILNDKVILYKLLFNPEGVLEKECCEARYRRTTYDFNRELPLPGISALLYEVTSSVFKTANGQCGMPYLSSGKGSRITAMHVAGDKGVSSYAFPVCHAMIKDAITAFVRRGIMPSLAPTVNLCTAGRPLAESAENSTHPIFFQPVIDGRTLEMSTWTAGNFSPRSEVTYNPHLHTAIQKLGVRMTKVKPSFRWRAAVHKTLAHATPIKSVGQLLVMSRAKDYISKMILRPAVDVFLEKHDHALWTRTPLTLDQIANGIPSTPITCMDGSKSSGIGGKKRDYVLEDEEGHRTFKPEIVTDVNRVLDQLRIGENPMIAPIAFLKDELLKEGKQARIVYNSPIQQFLLSASYIKVALEVMTASPVDTKTSIGMDPTGAEWGEVCKRFCNPRFVKNAFDLDQAAFDMSQSPQIRGFASSLLLGITEDLGFEEHDLLIVTNLLASLDDSPINLFGVKVWLQNLFASGYLMTAHRNGLVQVLLSVYDFLMFTEETGFKGDFLDHFEIITIGDDLLGAVSDELVSAGWNLEHIVNTARTWGFDLTTADKTREFKFKNFGDCEFMKRYYNYHEGCKMNVFVRGPGTYFQPFVGNVKGKDHEDSLYYSDQADTVLLEAFWGGELAFLTMRSRLRSFYLSLDGELATPASLNWEWKALCEHHKPAEPQPQYSSETEMGFRLIVEYDETPSYPSELAPEFKASRESFLSLMRETKWSDFVHPKVDNLPSRHLAESEEGAEIVGLQELTGQVAEVAGELHETEVSRMPLETRTEANKVLERRVLLATYSNWFYTPSIINPHSAMMDQDLFRDRFRNIAFVNTGVKLTFETVVPATTAGIAMASVVPFPSSVVPPSSMTALSHYENIWIRFGENATVSHLIIPFVSQEMAINPFDDSWIFQPAVAIKGLGNLVSSSNANPGFTLKVYGEFVGLKAYGATSIRSAKKPQSEAQELSKSLMATSKVAAIGSKITGLANLGLASEMLSKAGTMAANFGFSKPAANLQIGNVTTFFPNAMGSEYCSVLATNPDNETCPSVPGFSKDELQLEEFNRHWTIIDSPTISATDNYGKIITQYNVTPMIVIGNQPAACTVPALFHEFYRGSMEYRITAIVPTMITLKLAVFYDPLGDNHADDNNREGTPDEDYLEHIILDTALEQTATITVGYSVASPALHTTPRALRTHLMRMETGDYDPKPKVATTLDNLRTYWKAPNDFRHNLHNGRILIKVHDPVRGGSIATPPPIQIIVEARAGPDMQYAGYRGNLPASIKADGDLPVTPSQGVVPFPGCTKIPPEAVFTCESGIPTGGGGGFTPPAETPGPTVSNLPPSAQPTPIPTMIPTVQPTTRNPTSIPSALPSRLPSSQPTPFICEGVPITSTAHAIFMTYGYIVNDSDDFSLLGNDRLVASATNAGNSYMIIPVYRMPAVSTTLKVYGDFNGLAVGTNTMGDGTPVIPLLNAAKDTMTIVLAPPPGLTFYTTVGFPVVGVGWSITHFDTFIPQGMRLVTFRPGITGDLPPVSKGGINGVPLVTTGELPPPDVYPAIANYREGCTENNPITFIGQGVFQNTVNGAPIASAIAYPSSRFTENVQTSEVENGVFNSNDEAVFIYSLSMLVPEGIADNISNGEIPPPPPARRLGASDLFPSMFRHAAEGAVELSSSTTGGTHHFGAALDNSEFFTRVIAGESIVSFRGLLKIPHYIRDYRVEASAGFRDVTSQAPIYTDNELTTHSTLYWYLYNTFAAMRGSIVYHYMIIGDATLEVSRKFQPSDDSYPFPEGGVTMTNSRVNPKLSIRFPQQRTAMFTWAHGVGDESSSTRLIRINTTGDPVHVRELRSTGEDFSFIYRTHACPLKEG